MAEFTISSTGSVTSPKGFRASGICCGIKDSKDMALVASDVGSKVSAVFTTNKFPAAPVVVSRKVANSGFAQALVINSGNANACTGEQGMQDARTMTKIAAKHLGIKEEMVLVASTGVIGRRLPMDKISAGIPAAVKALSHDGGHDAARAIMTTDTVPKHFSVQFAIGDNPCTIGAMTKGSGMICPNMATTISVLTTDVAISGELLQKAFKGAISTSLNSLTVDGTQSTNDCAFLFANGLAGNEEIKTEGPSFAVFQQALNSLCVEMARSLARDGEGATKLMVVKVSGAKNDGEARKAALEIANAPLVKTAVFGRDPNWGRIFAAVGGCGVDLDPNKTNVRFAGVAVAQNGGAIAYDHEQLKHALEQDEIEIHIELGAGSGKARVFSCDLTYDYVRINAEYTT